MTPSQPSPTDLSDELDRILTGYAKYVKNAQGLYSYATEKKLSKKQAKAAITAAYAEAIRSAVPEKKTVNWQNADSVESIASQSENYGFNAAIDTFTANLQKEGLLPTNGSDGGGADKPHGEQR